MKDDLQINIDTKRHLRTVIARYGRFFILALAIISCDGRTELLDQEKYEGPLSMLEDLNTFMSDSGRIMLQIQAPKEEAYENGDREWKEGLFLRYFDELGDVSSTFKSNYAFYDKKEHLYKGVGDVVVENVTNGDVLNTEELFWDPRKQEFYTERFVTIHTEDEIHTGEGLTANEDFSMYKILKPAGTFTLEEGAPTIKNEDN